MTRALLLHGYTNRRWPGHWIRRLNAALRDEGSAVQYPQLPDTDHPRLADWCDVVAAELELMHESGHGETVVVAHSLGCVTLLHLALQGRLAPAIDRILLVAPADPAIMSDLPDFANLDVAAAAEPLRQAARSTTLVASDADPYLPRGIDATFSVPLGAPAVVIPGAAHLSLDDGWGPWQGVIDWVRDPAADLRVR